jgi:hypothetical protein
MLNLEIADDPFYRGLEMQGFDDPRHGRGVVVFFDRRADRKIDVYYESGVRPDPKMYAIGGGLGELVETEFDVARLSVAADGIDAEARFVDIEGRAIELRISDRPRKPRRWATLLAPGGAAIADPQSLPLWWMSRFDLLRRTRSRLVVRIDGRDAKPGRLPVEWLTRRRLIKVASDILLVDLNPVGDERGRVSTELLASDEGLEKIAASVPEHHVVVRFDPPLPDPAEESIGEGGSWDLSIDSQPVVGGIWSASHHGHDVQVGIDVTRGWKPRGLPILMKIVTRVLPLFRTWPTTYRWRGTLRLGDTPNVAGRWERVGDERDESFRSFTKSE